MSDNQKNKRYVSGDLKKLTEDMKYIADVAKKWGYNKSEAEEAGFHIGDALDDMRQLLKGVDSRNLSPTEFYEIMSHLPYHIERAHQSLRHDVSAGVYDFIEQNVNLFKQFIQEIEQKRK